MKLKLNEQGFAVVVDGKPVYVHDDGKEIPTDVPGLVQTINRVNGEAKTHRMKAEEFEAKAKLFDGLDPEAARKAVETVANLDAKKLIDAGEVERVKGETAKAYEERLRTMSEQAKAIQAERDALKGTLDGERIANAFAKSKYIADKLAVPLDMVQAAFGSRFKADDDGVFAYDANGNKMISRQRPGEYATFDEAVELLVEAYPHRDSILKGSGASGGGARGSGGTGGGKTMSRAQFTGMDPAAQMAHIKAGGTVTD